MARLSTEERGQAIGMPRAGRSQTTVSRILRCSRSSISRLWLKFQQTGKSFSAISFRPSLLCFFRFDNFFVPYSTPTPSLPTPFDTTNFFHFRSCKDRPRAPRSRVTTRAQDNRLRTQHLHNRYRPATRTSATMIENHGRPISAQTVINRLRAHGICSVAGRSMEPGSVLWWVQVHPREIRWTCSRLLSFRWTLHWRLCQTDWQIPWRIGYGVGWHKQQQENKLGHY